MELSDKILQNLIALSAGALKGQQINVEPGAMAELWQDVAQADAYLKAKKENAVTPKAEGGSDEHG
jgi:hypothetical protein